MLDAELVNFPNQNRIKELEKTRDLIVKEFDGMTSQEISLLLKLVKDVVNTKLVFIV